MEQDECFWLAVLACLWIEVFKALMAMVVSPWCRILKSLKARFGSNLNPVMFFFVILVDCI